MPASEKPNADTLATAAVVKPSLRAGNRPRGTEPNLREVMSSPDKDATSSRGFSAAADYPSLCARHSAIVRPGGMLGGDDGSYTKLAGGSHRSATFSRSTRSRNHTSMRSRRSDKK